MHLDRIFVVSQKVLQSEKFLVIQIEFVELHIPLRTTNSVGIKQNLGGMVHAASAPDTQSD